MKREWPMMALIFVPFAVLVWLGFGFLERAPAPGSPAKTAPLGPPAPVALPATGRPAPTAAQLETPGAPAPDSGEPVPPELKAPLAAIAPQVAVCLQDARSQAEGALTLRIAFRPTPDGGFDSMKIVSSSWQDPYLFACLEDAFEEVRFVPTGAETFRPVQWSF